MKKLFYGLVLIIIVVSIVAKIAPKFYSYETDIVINKPKNEVRTAIKPPETPKSYLVYEGQKTQSQVSIDAVKREKKHNKLGSFVRDTMDVKQGDSYLASIGFIEELKLANQVRVVLETVDANHTKVAVGLSGANGFPVNLLMNGYAAIAKRDIRKNLINLKATVEAGL